MAAFPLYRQFDERDCGPACLRMISKFYGRSFTLETLREICHINKYGTSLLSLSDGAEEIGFRTLSSKISKAKLYAKALLPCIAFVNDNHFVVIYKISSGKVHIADPGKGQYKLSKAKFEEMWLRDGKGVIMMLEPTLDFFDKGDEVKKTTFQYFLKYVSPFRREIIQIVIGILFGSVLAFIIPFISQSVIDYGINGQNLGFIQIMIIAQIILTLSSTLVGMIQSWLQMHIGARMSIAMLSDFIMKVLKLPFSFIQNRSTGDIMQRMADNGRVLRFVTSSPISILFSLLYLIVYGGIMVTYSLPILLIFVAGNALYAIWLFAFLGKRKELDYEGFSLKSENENKVLELFQGTQDIKLNNLEKDKRNEWEEINSRQYLLGMKGLKLGQIQSSGTMIISQTQSILISYIAAKSVIMGDMTLGMMFSVQYMLGQLSQPFSTFLGFIHSVQDVKLSMERLSEINDKKTEDAGDHYIKYLPAERSIEIKDLNFRYEGKSSDPVLKDISFTLPKNKITAIVGKSGSGKTTLLKLLLKLMNPTEGNIMIGEESLENIKPRDWRNLCGSVMQDSYIFNDTIAKNIVLYAPKDRKRLYEICQKLNISEFVSKLPLRYDTKIGSGNHSLSTGQYQRILLARAIYKNPDYLFLDEVTSSLDTENENSVMKYLNELKTNKTIFIAAHRLSTVMNADQIIVMEKGKIIQTGTHQELIAEKEGMYHQLVTSKLDL